MISPPEATVLETGHAPEKFSGEHDERILQTQITRLISGSGFSNLAGIAMAIIWVGLIWKNLPHDV